MAQWLGIRLPMQATRVRAPGREDPICRGAARPIPLVVKGIKQNEGASLVAQWLRVCLLMQGTRVRALVWEDPTCRGATGPVSHNY